jgi:hypothetical protein
MTEEVKTFYEEYLGQRLLNVEPQSKIPLNEFEEWVNGEVEGIKNKHTRHRRKCNLYNKRSIDRMHLRQSQQITLKGECIKMSNDALLYPESHTLVRHGVKLWVHDLSVADFACFKDEENQIMLECLRVGEWAIEQFKENIND